MHWVLLIGGEASRASGKIVHRASLQHCSPQQLGDTIEQSMQNLYSFPDGLEPPSPHLQTWVLGFQLQDQRMIETKVLPEMKHRMQRLGVPWKYDASYEDEPEGFKNFNLLSREKCMAWFQSIADQLMDSKVEAEIVLYEFSDRPEGFPKVDLPEVSEPWKRAAVAILDNGSHSEHPLRPYTSLTAKLLPANPVGPSRPVERGGAVTGDGAGPSRPKSTVHDLANPDTVLNLNKSMKTAGIRAALQYNGYPSDVIEDLLENKLWLNPQSSKKSSFQWRLRLPNGEKAGTYSVIDANPYPGGKVTEFSERKCYRSENCTKLFGHGGSCRLNVFNDGIDLHRKEEMKFLDEEVFKRQVNDRKQRLLISQQHMDGAGDGGKVDNEDLNSGEGIVSEDDESLEDYGGSLGFSDSMQDCCSEEEEGHKDGTSDLKNFAGTVTGNGAGPSRPSKPLKVNLNPNTANWKARKMAKIKAALQYNGYPPEVIEDLLQDDFTIRRRANMKNIDWELQLSNGECVRSMVGIDANPYPGGKVTEKSARKCLVSENCTKPFGHGGNCLQTAFGRIDSNKNHLNSNRTALALPKTDATQHPSAGVNDGAGPSRRKDNTENLDADNSTEALLHRATAGVRTALLYAGYPTAVVDSLMKNEFRIWALPHSKKKYYWSLKLPGGKRITRNKNDILKYPYPGGKVTANRICHTLGCEKEFGHLGPCPIHRADRYKIKREADGEPMSPPPVIKKARGISPSTLISQPPRSILSSSSDDDDGQEEEENEESDDNKEEVPRPESPIYLLTTTEEADNSDEEGEDEYSSLAN